MNGPPRATPEALDRATVAARRARIHTELLAAMQAVERYKGALGVLDDLLTLEEPEAP